VHNCQETLCPPAGMAAGSDIADVADWVGISDAFGTTGTDAACCNGAFPTSEKIIIKTPNIELNKPKQLRIQMAQIIIIIQRRCW